MSSASAPRHSPMRDLREGVVYVWTTPAMRAAIEWFRANGYAPLT